MFPTRFFNLRAFARRFFPRPGGGTVVLLPDNTIEATQSVTEIERRIGYTETERSITATHARRTVTFDG